METLSKSIEAARHLGSTAPPAKRTATARDLMATDLVTFGPEDTIGHVIEVLLTRRISGAPVVDERRRLIGIISEGDCMRLVSAESYDGEGHARQHRVRDVMSTEVTSVTPETDLYRMARTFAEERRRRLPVVEDGIVIGQVSRRDLLRAIP